MPSPASLGNLAQIVGLVVFAYYWTTQRRFPRVRDIVAFVVFMTAIIGLYEGFLITVHEDARSRYGHVKPGVVVEMFRSDHKGHTISTGGSQGPLPGRSAYLSTAAIAHWIAYRSPEILIVDYRFACDVGRNGTCYGRDWVGPELWARLQPGGSVNVRQAQGEGAHARLDENPQLVLGVVQLAVAGVFLIVAGLLSGRIDPLKARPRYMNASAVVVAVEPVTYRDATRWKIRFAYFDGNGDAQESADEVNRDVWKPGDSCVAVYRSDQPSVATLGSIAPA